MGEKNDSKAVRSMRLIARSRKFQAIAALWIAAFATVASFVLRGANPKRMLDGYRRLTQTVQHHSNPAGTCIADSADMPSSWKSRHKLSFPDSGEPWTKEEQKFAHAAVVKGITEMTDFLSSIGDRRVLNIGTNAFEALADQAAGASNNPEIYNMAIESSAKIYKIYMRSYMEGHDDEELECEDASSLLDLAQFAISFSHEFPDDKELKNLKDEFVKRTNVAISDCVHATEYVGFDYKRTFSSEMRVGPQTVFNWIVLGENVLDLLAQDELKVPEGSHDFVAQLWKFLATYEFQYGRDVEDWEEDESWSRHGFAATHAAYIPTGYEHLQLVSDAPWLYKYIRENFYEAMDYGAMDLFSEFVDILRQYGCTEETDAQVRHGARYLLNIYKQAGNSWINQRDEGETDPSDYTLIHKPWTALSGVKPRDILPEEPGTHGYEFRKAIEAAAQE